MIKTGKIVSVWVEEWLFQAIKKDAVSNEARVSATIRKILKEKYANQREGNQEGNTGSGETSISPPNSDAPAPDNDTKASQG